MPTCVERRFKRYRASHALTWLTDNGRAYTSHEMVAFARSLGLMLCFTSVRSLEFMA